MKRSTSKRLEAIALLMRGAAKAGQGNLAEGREDMRAGRDLLHDLGDQVFWGGTSMVVAETELAVGVPTVAYDALEAGYDVLVRSAETGYVATVVAYRAQAALELGREDEALAFADEAERIGQRDDFEPHARQRLVRARVAGRRGQFEQAEELLREAAAIIEPTDYFIVEIDWALAEAEIARLVGNTEREREALERALSAAEAKGALVIAARARQQLAGLA